MKTVIDLKKGTEMKLKHHGKKKAEEAAQITTFSDWLGGFWRCLGGFFKKRLSVITGSHTFTEVGNVDYFIDTPDGWNRLEFSPEKVWFTVDQSPDLSEEQMDECNMITMHRNDDGVWLMGTINHVPCKVTWIILV
jgi:hypothetical protein